MYQFSLEKYNELFKFLIEREKKWITDKLDKLKTNDFYKNASKSDKKKYEDEYIPEFIILLIKELTLYIFSQCSRSLFEEHKILFSFFISSKIALSNKIINNDE